MKTTMLLGTTKDNEIVFGEWELHHPHLWSKEKGNWVDEDVLEFSASFNTVRPFNGSECDLVDYFSSPELHYGKEQAYDLCEKYDCSPRDLAQCMADECDDPRDAMDCSLYPEEYEINGDYWYFESCSCGQHDTRNEMKTYVNKEAYDMLMDLWNRYHLKNVANIIDKVQSKLDKIEQLLNVDEEQWIANYIKENLM